MCSSVDSSAPILKSDGIYLKGDHLRRSDIVDNIIHVARTRQHVIVGSPPATGKTALLQLVEQKLRGISGSTVHRLHLKDRGPDNLFLRLTNKGIKEDSLTALEKCWLILDDAQNMYDDVYDAFWPFVVKDIGSASVEDNLSVIIAATYDYGTTRSPVQFKDLPHVHGNISLEEANELFSMHTIVWGYQGWKKYSEALLAISRLDSGEYHIGVIIGGIRLLEESRKRPGRVVFDEAIALSLLRSGVFIDKLDRCFQLSASLPLASHDIILDVLLNEEDGELPENATLDGLVRMGILTTKGKFSCLAANWYYNRRCFPTRAMTSPETLDDLVKRAVCSMSAKRLRDTLQDGFPKEATFQHLFNEGLSLHLPINNYIIPELNTSATDASGNIVTGELDFYVNGSLQWCLELLRNGDKVREHLDRFGSNDGKYREVAANDSLVVDCRGPKTRAVTADESRCTLYFSPDFTSCVCKMRLEKETTLSLAP